MAAFTAPCAITGTSTPMAAWKRQESSDSGDMDQNTILEKTHEFFQMCDIENKGFINRRDMQVRLLIQMHAVDLPSSNIL